MKVRCPVDPAHATSSFSSLQEIYCHECKQNYPWLLKAGQAPLITTSRDTRGKQ